MNELVFGFYPASRRETSSSISAYRSSKQENERLRSVDFVVNPTSALLNTM
jgi:hypothetical protein